MSDIVVDSSVVAKWVLPEPDSAQAQQLITDAAAAGDRLIVLDLVFVEVGNAIWKSHRQRQMTTDKARRAHGMLMKLPVHVETAAPRLADALEIAMQYDRAVYDALFVALAVDVGAPAVTADVPLVNVLGAAYPQIKLLRDWP